MNLRNHNIVSVVEDITLSIAEYTQSKNITLIFDTGIEEKNIALDKEKVERVILNLLSNAVKFTENNGKIYVKVCNGNEHVSISIKDTGVGSEFTIKLPVKLITKDSRINIGDVFLGENNTERINIELSDVYL